MSEIKPAIERIKENHELIAEKNVPKILLKLAEYETEERNELRAVYEALQKENAELRDRITIMDEAAKYYNETIIGISNKLHAENEALKLKKEFIEYAAQDLENQNEALKAENEAQAKRIAELEKKESTAIEHLTKVVEEINHLMNDSEGVAGLHQNGDIAPWASLLRGGEFEEWLSYLSDAAEFVQSYGDDKKGGE